MQELRDSEEIDKFLEGPLAGCIFPSNVERSLAIAASLVIAHSGIPCVPFSLHLHLLGSARKMSHIHSRKLLQ